MKKLILAICFLTTLTSVAQNDLLLTIDGKVLEIASDKEYEVPVNGKKVKIMVTTKDTLTYENEMFSFQYPKDFKISSVSVEEGIEQITLMSAEGSGVLIQRYSTINPTMFNEMMINEVTKESVNYGFKLTRADYDRTIGSGQTIQISKAILRYKDEINIYEVATMGKKDEGILVMTMIMDEMQSEQGRKLIDLMWNSLQYK